MRARLRIVIGVASISKLGHDVRLSQNRLPKAYVRRNNNDPASTPRRSASRDLAPFDVALVTIKTRLHHASSGIPQVREMLIKHRTMLSNTCAPGLWLSLALVVAEGPQRTLSATL